MLIIKAFVNYRQIDAIGILNVSEDHGIEYGHEEQIYQIAQPKEYREKYGHHLIHHVYEDGWSVLCEKVLHIINNA